MKNLLKKYRTELHIILIKYVAEALLTLELRQVPLSQEESRTVISEARKCTLLLGQGYLIVMF